MRGDSAGRPLCGFRWSAGLVCSTDPPWLGWGVSQGQGRSIVLTAASRRPQRRLLLAVAIFALVAADTARAAEDGSIVFSRSKLVGGRELPPRVLITKGDGTGERALKPRLAGYVPFWTAAGRRVAVFDWKRTRLTTISRKGRQRQTVQLGLPHNPRTGSHALSFDLAPNGKSFAFGYVRFPTTNDETETYSSFIQPPTGPPRELPGSAAEGLGSPAFSPDGKSVALRNGISVWLAPADGSEPARPLARPLPTNVDLSGLDWSPDGATIAAGAITGRNGSGTLQLIRVATGAIRLLATDRTRNSTITQVVFSPDGKRIAYERTGGREPTEIWIHDLASGKNTRLISNRGNGGRFGPVAWSPNSRKLAVDCTYACQRPQGIWAVDMKRRWTRLTSGRDTLGDWSAR